MNRSQNKSNQHRGFTLVEIVVVLTIIVLIASAALPAYRFISGSRSLDNTQNMISAMLSRARSLALVSHQARGVFFFIDTINDRTVMALVQQETDSTLPDLDSYKGWTAVSPSTPASGLDQYNPIQTGMPAIYYYANPVAGSSDGISFAFRLGDQGNEVFRLPSGPSPRKRLTISQFSCIIPNTPSVKTPANAHESGYRGGNGCSVLANRRGCAVIE
jgi:prepilin-type N-terminal cleavage/methylation domain-containing protein